MDKDNSLHLTLTDKAAYWVGRKAFALTDDSILLRVPYADMHCRVGYRSQVLSWLLGLPCCGVFGVVVTTGENLGAGFTALAVGLSLILFGRKRRVVTLTGPDARFRWKAPVILDRASRDSLDRSLGAVAEAARAGGASVDWIGPRPRGSAAELNFA